MKEAVHGKAKVKAAGGVRTPEDMVKIVAAGADRILSLIHISEPTRH